MGEITPITMPKWGLAMQEGMVAKWNVAAGDTIKVGQEIMDIETSKIANVFESPVGGTLRKIVVADGEIVPVGALLGVVADASVGDAEIDAFVEEFRARFATEAQSSAPPEPRMIDAGGLAIRYLEAGDGSDTIILVHGFGSDHTTWALNQGELAQEARVIAVDLPGHGGSGKDVGAGDIPSLADIMLAFMDAVGIEKAGFVGHSLGGGVALDLALRHPFRVSALTLIAPCGLGPEINADFISGFIAETRARKLRSVLEALTVSPDLISGEMVDNVIRFKRIDGAEAALRKIAATAYAGGVQAWQARNRIADLSIPVKVIFGADDKIIPARHGEGLPANVEVRILSGAGHLPHVERPAEVNAIIAA
jgi:pyruvate dehydrogenase E2 component (dihydrolipoamide acetyltransferase)